MKALHILRPGRFVAANGDPVELSQGDLDGVAAAYDPGLHEAPIVVGHPADNAPAFGWVASLAATADGLTAEPTQLDAAFVEAHRAGRYKKISASIYRPGVPGNPAPDGYYLRHVGFLGAAPPAVKGLRGADLAEDAAGCVCLVLDLDLAEPEEPMSTKTPATTDPTDLAEQRAALAERERALRVREAQLAKQAGEAQLAEFAEFARSLDLDGRRLAPRYEAQLAEVMGALSEAGEIAFGDGDQQQTGKPLDLLREVLTKGLAATVDYTERSADEGDAADAVDFAAPPGYTVDPQALTLHRRAEAYMRAHDNVTYEAALVAVGRSKK